MKTVAIITAAGYGKRMGQPKQFLKLAGKPILEYTLAVYDKAKCIDAIILVVNTEDVEKGKKLRFRKLKAVVAGGKERQASVFEGLKALPQDAEIVAIHDGARPLVSDEIIERAIQEARNFGAVVVGVPVVDTIKSVNGNQLRVTRTIDRSELWAAQTPQVFKKEIILRAYQAGASKHQVTDDAMLVEKLGIPVKMVMGSYHNLKITRPEDLEIAEILWRRREKR